MPEQNQDYNPNDIDLEQPGKDSSPIPAGFPEPKINPYPMGGGSIPGKPQPLLAPYKPPSNTGLGWIENTKRHLDNGRLPRQQIPYNDGLPSTSRQPWGQWSQKALPPAGGTGTTPYRPPEPANPYKPYVPPSYPQQKPPSHAVPGKLPWEQPVSTPYQPLPSKAPVGRTPLPFAEPPQSKPNPFFPTSPLLTTPPRPIPPSAPLPVPPPQPVTAPLGRPNPLFFNPLPPTTNPNTTPPTPTQPPQPKPGQNIKPNQGEPIALYPTPILWRCEARWEESDPLGGNKVNMTNITDLLSNFEPYLEKYTEPTSFSWVWSADSRGPDYPWSWRAKSPGTRTGIRWVYGTPDDIKYHVIRTGIEIPTNIKKEQGFLSRPQGGDLPTSDTFYKPGTSNYPNKWPIPNPNATGLPKDASGNRNKGMPNTSPAPSINPNGGKNPQPKQDRKPIQDRPRIKQPKYNPPVVPNKPTARSPFSPTNPIPSDKSRDRLPIQDTPRIPRDNPRDKPLGQPSPGNDPRETNTNKKTDSKTDKDKTPLPIPSPYPFPMPSPRPNDDCPPCICDEDDMKQQPEIKWKQVDVPVFEVEFDANSLRYKLVQSTQSISVIGTSSGDEVDKIKHLYKTNLEIAQALIDSQNKALDLESFSLKHIGEILGKLMNELIRSMVIKQSIQADSIAIGFSEWLNPIINAITADKQFNQTLNENEIDDSQSADLSEDDLVN